jgi:HEPN domain-containing protein
MIDLLKRAQEDKKICEKLEVFLPDEFAARGCGFHIQQAIEKEMKAYLLINGIEYPKTHNIQKLLNLSKNVEFPLSDELCDKIEDMSDTLLNWETNNRYDPYTSFSERKYNRAVDIYTQLEKRILTITNENTEENKIDNVVKMALDFMIPDSDDSDEDSEFITSHKGRGR